MSFLQKDRRSFLFGLLEKLEVSDSRPGHRFTVPVQIARARFDLLTSSEEIATRFRGYYSEYLSAEPTRTLVQIEPLAVPGFDDLWEDPDAEFETHGETVVQRDFAAKRFRLENEERVFAWINPGEPEDAVHNLLRWVLPDLLLCADSFLMHAASVVHRERGFVFFGQSGAGKSTCTQLISNADPKTTILGDDAGIIELSRDGKACWVHSAPLGCGYSKAPPPFMRAQIAGIFSLHQGQTHSIEELSRSEGMSQLLASAMAADFNRAVDDRFDLASGFAGSHARIRRLHFKKDGGFWEKINLEQN